MVTPDGLDVDTTMAGFTVSPHEECAVEEAVRITERLGGSVSVLTLGPPEAADQPGPEPVAAASDALLGSEDNDAGGEGSTAAGGEGSTPARDLEDRGSRAR